MHFAVAGCGVISRFHLDAIRSIEDAALCGVYDPVEASARAAAQAYGTRAYPDYDALLADPQVDAVCICTPSHLHAPLALQAVAAGKHVLIEKPVALTLEDCDAVAAAARAAGVQVGVVSQLRYGPAVARVKRALESGALGRITRCDLYMKYFRPQSYYDSGTWRGTQAMDGGGALMNQCIHSIDLLRWMLGDGVTEVMAYTDNLNHPYIQAEDLGLALVRFESGAYGVVEGTTNVYPHNLEETLYLFGENGTVKAGGKSVNIIEEWDFRDGRGDPATIKMQFGENPPNVYGYGHTPLYADVIAAIREDRAPYVDGRAGMRALELVLAIYLSAAEHRPVRLPLADCATTDFEGRFGR